MQDAIRTQGAYLKCDACPYVSSKMPRDLTKADIGTPCPDCGADMLTARDFYDYSHQLAAIAYLNKTTELLGEKLGIETKQIRISIHTHDGNLTIEASENA